MATSDIAMASMKSDSNRLSFAKVVAGNKENVLSTSARVAAATAVPRQPAMKGSSQNSALDGAKQLFTPSVVTSPPTSGPRNNGSKAKVTVPSEPQGLIKQLNYDSKLIDAVKAINLDGTSSSVAGNVSTPSVAPSVLTPSESSPDDVFQRTDSGSELGTKPPSLDGKSITSGTTFALDEKESLRPDDSASVKAAEDDDTFSGLGVGSRIGSEAAARAYRAQTYELSDRRTAPNSEAQGILTPQSGSSGQQVLSEANAKSHVGPSITVEGFSMFYKQGPDDKLLEALESPKDRIFLLRLEQELITFVKDSKEPYIDLPPSNSFCRLLTHKLADYYHMTHQYDNVTQSVRIFRTPFCRLPQSLTAISNPPTTGNTPPPVMPTMKIMRRGDDKGMGGSPSKPTSESGSDGKDRGMSAKEKLTREAREALYKEARERIFGEKGGDATPETEEGQDISRSSSVSVKDKSAPNRRGKSGKQRRDDAESFDVRSQYTPMFPHQSQQAWAPRPQYAPISVQQFNTNMQSGFQLMPGPQFVAPGQQYQPGMGAVPGMMPYNQAPQSQPAPNHMMSHQMPMQIPQPYPRVNPPHYQAHSAPITAYGSPVQSPAQQSQPWNQTMYTGSYQARAPAQMQPTIPYPYGQLPPTANAADPKSQHPIPGSFNRHAFNPKTQSFVPGNAGMPIPQPMPHHGSPHMPYAGYPSSPPMNNGMGYNMSRQGSNTSLPSFHASPHMAPRPMMHQGMSTHGPPHSSHLPPFGNISTLPPKPPPAV